MNWRFLMLCICVPYCCICQSFLEKDTVYNKNRVLGTTVAIAGGWTISMTGLAQVWYKDSWQGSFQFFNDGDEWLQMDKVGHAYTGYHLTRNSYNLYQWSGMNKSSSMIIGAAIGFGYLANLEIFDGFSADWGFSWWDLAANGLGVGLFAGQAILWDEQRIIPKFSVGLSPYAQYRPGVLGASIPERILKDYNGQTYWLSASPKAFSQKLKNIPPWISLSFGYSIDGKLHGVDNVFVVNNNGQLETIYAERQWLFSLDIDFERIPTQKPFLRTLFKALNHLKVPFPALMYSPSSSFKFIPVYF